MNFNKKHSAFRKGMKPSTFSIKKWEILDKGWDCNSTLNVSYWFNPFNKVVNLVARNKDADKYKPIGKDNKKLESSSHTHNPHAKKLYALAFSYKWVHDKDEVYFAFSIPYSYSQMNRFLDETICNSNTVRNKEIIFVK